MSGRRVAVVRAVGLLGAAWGVTLLTRGERIWRSLDATAPTELDRLAIRALGIRHLLQGTVQAAVPSHAARAATGIDLVHAASMLALAAADPGRRRPALVTAAVAGASAATTLTAWRGLGRRRPAQRASRPA